MACSQFHIIQESDTLFAIASTYFTTPDNILRLNPWLDPDNLPVGGRICVISATEQNVQCPFGTLPYNINNGDTLKIIADRFGSSIAAIMIANPGINPQNLQVGQRICIPQGSENVPECTSGNLYTIKKGDTLSKIAQSFDVTVRSILELNEGLNPRNLTIGEIICIPLAPSPIEIIISVSGKRLSVFRNGRLNKEYIVATGKPETPTPIGTFTIVNKEVDPGGPYGTRWLGLSIRGYGIHGTNAPESIGTAASNGCIRMYNEDVEALFDVTPIGTVVRILP